MRARTLLPSILLSLGLIVPAAESATLSWNDYRLGQYVASRERAPSDILALDNNGEILLACREGCTLEGLAAAGVPALASQLELLRGWALLAESEGGMRAGVPILDGRGAELLGRRAAEIAAKLEGAVEADVAELVTTLEAAGWGEHAWAVLFSYILDGGVWVYLDELEVVTKRGLSRSGAPWGGEVWAYPAGRENEPKTSTVQGETIAIRIGWVEELRPHVASLLSGPMSLRALFSDSLEKGDAESSELGAKLMRYGLVNAERELTVPLIEERKGDPLRDLCERITATVAERIVRDLNRAALVNDLGLQRESQAMVIAYHRVAFALMDRLVESGAVALPAAIGDPAGAEPADIGKLVVLARRPAPPREDTEARRDQVSDEVEERPQDPD